jgi:micrococcal nuclease
MRAARLALVGLVVLAGCAGSATRSSVEASVTLDEDSPSSAPEFATPQPPPDARSAQVVFVQDGDSIRVEIDGQEERVRLIGINTPEQGECFGDEARALMTELVAGQQVLVSTDVDAYDQYGRILGYVWIDDLFVNAELVLQGAALARAYEPNTTLQSFLDDAERIAQDAGSGMWSATACGSTEQFDVTITAINADATGRDNENRNGEWITITSSSSTEIDLTGWTVKDESSVHRYTFADGVRLAPGASLVLFTGCGQDQPSEFYWCDDTPVWDNSGDTGFLLDPNGTIVSQYGY